MNKHRHLKPGLAFPLAALLIAASLSSCTVVVPDEEPTVNTSTTTTRKSLDGYPASSTSETRTTRTY